MLTVCIWLEAIADTFEFSTNFKYCAVVKIDLITPLNYIYCYTLAFNHFPTFETQTQ